MHSDKALKKNKFLLCNIHESDTNSIIARNYKINGMQ